MWLSTTIAPRALSSVGQRLYTMSYVVDWRSSVSSRTQWHDLVEDRGVQLWLGLGNRGALTAMSRHASLLNTKIQIQIQHIFVTQVKPATSFNDNDARDWTHFVLVYVHVLRVRRRVGRIGVL